MTFVVTQHVRRIQTVFLVLLLCAFVPYAAQAQTTVASDNGDNYSGGYVGSNQGTGFSTGFVETGFGSNDNGGTFLTGSTRAIDGTNSFAMFAGDTGSGAAVSRSFSTPLSGSDRYRIETLVRFDLTTDGGTAGT